LRIRITPQGCSLAEKIDGVDERRGGGLLLTDPVPAPHFLLLLRRYGLMLTPDDEHAPLLALARKTAKIERDVALGMSLVAGGYRLKSSHLNKQLPTTHAAILLAPAHLPLTRVETHWTMEPPVWASRVCHHKHLKVDCRKGFGHCNKPKPPRPQTGEGEHEEQVVEEEEPPQGAWGEDGLEACFLDGWDTVLFRSHGAAKLQVPDKLLCCCILPPPVCPPQPPAKTDEVLLYCVCVCVCVCGLFVCVYGIQTHTHDTHTHTHTHDTHTHTHTHTRKYIQYI